MTIEDRAKKEADDVLTYFEQLETLGRFAGEQVKDQKHVFLTFSLINFARREALLHSREEASSSEAINQ